MLYYLDGYNLIFSHLKRGNSLREQRDLLIEFLRTEFTFRRWKGLLVFDGFCEQGEDNERAYAGPLQIVYTSKKQSADDYILEHLRWRRRQKKACTLVSNDQHLIKEASLLRASSLSNENFLHSILKEAPTSQDYKETKVSRREMDRWLSLFEKRSLGN